MPLEDLTTITLAFHGATLIPLGVALQKFGDRTESFQKSLAGTSEALIRLRRLLASELERDVGALLSTRTLSTQTLVLDAAGDAFSQTPSNVGESEAFRNCIHEFATRQQSGLVAYHSLSGARDAWARWARRVSWSVLLLFGWEAVAFGSIAAIAKLADITIARVLLFASYAPTGVSFGLFMAAQALSLRHHDRILDIRRTHDPI